MGKGQGGGVLALPSSAASGKCNTVRWNCGSITGVWLIARGWLRGLTNRGTGGRDAEGAVRGFAQGVSSPSSGHSYTESSDHLPRIRSFSCFRMAMAARKPSPRSPVRIVRRRDWAMRSRQSISTGAGGKVGMVATRRCGHANTIFGDVDKSQDRRTDFPGRLARDTLSW